ncbi:MAG: FAD-binding oxidoreductase [Bacteroidota bacterium]|nr:FAD-binding oxidoreductase [Bacteroidota bacterium]
MKISNWGNYPVVDATILTPSLQNEVMQSITVCDKMIARGLGRSYGDASLNKTILSTKKLDHILGFDEKTGIITCEAGVSLFDLLEIFVPRGWFLPVTPGTKYVTIGGAVAADVHGKNHHIASSFSRYVLSITIQVGDGSTVVCSRTEQPDLFCATCGGMGLTGIILKATFQLLRIETAFIRQETVKAKNLDEIMNIFEESTHWTYSVAWLDTLAKGSSLGRSVMIRGAHARNDELIHSRDKVFPLRIPNNIKVNVPFTMPDFVLSPITMKIFNIGYYGITPNGRTVSIVDYDKFFYPLDCIVNWNRGYGKRGLAQYQFVLPKETSKEGLTKILKMISGSDHTSFLTVLKLFGKRGEGTLSFPMEGYNLALDFPIRKGLFEFLDLLDEVVLEFGGRLYLAKDARMSASMFKKSYSAIEEFLRVKKKFDPQNKFQSLQSRRIGLS